MSRERATPGPKGETSGPTPLHVPDCKELRAFEIVAGARCRQRGALAEWIEEATCPARLATLAGARPRPPRVGDFEAPERTALRVADERDVEHDAVYGDGGAAVQLHHDLQPTGLLGRPRRLKLVLRRPPRRGRHRHRRGLRSHRHKPAARVRERRAARPRVRGRRQAARRPAGPRRRPAGRMQLGRLRAAAMNTIERLDTPNETRRTCEREDTFCRRISTTAATRAPHRAPAQRGWTARYPPTRDHRQHRPARPAINRRYGRAPAL